MSGLAARIAVLGLAVAGVALVIVAIGVLVFGASAFDALMIEHGSTAEVSRAMFDESVRTSFMVSGLAAVLLSLGLAIFLGRRISGPLARIDAAARRIADGELSARAPSGGPAEVASLADSFNDMAARLEEHERSRSEFVANAAHELRTPLTNLVGYLEALRDGVVAPTRETFVSLREEVDRLARLSRSLDALAAEQGDADVQEPTEVRLAEAVADAVELMQPSFERRGIAVDVEVAGDPRVRVVEDHLAQILANLLQNAVRYTPEGGTVAISGEPHTTDVLLSVTNSGPGIPAADLGRVFERFYRVEKSRDRTHGGAGIGLAIVKQLVERSGGRVGAESSNGMTRFWFSLPGRGTASVISPSRPARSRPLPSSVAASRYAGDPPRERS
jgi:signal transduction histidine kinase